MRSGLRSVTSLLELQTRVMAALLGTSSDDALPLVDLPADAARARLQVYRNTVHSNFLEALRSTYPAIQRLVGEDYFRQVARNFGSRHPSRSGDLLAAGALFGDTLAELHADDEFKYLADVARLEWRIQEALLAPDHPPLDLRKLADVPPAAYDGLYFIPHPALRLFESPYPAQRIWEVNVGGEAEPEFLDLTHGMDRLAVMRHRLQLHFHRLSAAEYCLLSALQRGEPFAASLEAAEACMGEFDASAALQRLVAIAAIVDFRFTQS